MVAVLSGSATLAIAIQALLLLNLLQRIGFRIRFRWGFGGLGYPSMLTGWTILGPSRARLRTWSGPASPIAPGRPSASWASTDPA